MLFPMIIRMLDKFELTDEGKIQHLENYLIEVVELFQESIVVLTPTLHIIRGNSVTSQFFGNPFIDSDVTTYVHPDDLGLFRSTMNSALSSYAHTAVTLEYRIATFPSNFGSSSYFIEDNHPTYRWVESTLCAGTATFDADKDSVDGDDDEESVSTNYDLKINMITRDIQKRKEAEHLQDIEESSKERERVNEAKLRYISCTAHDLKTPLHSFCFVLDLLKKSDITRDQKELIEQADVSIDLMRLTISQTMDITKALTGMKLEPRRTTVQLSSIIKRVQIIM